MAVEQENSFVSLTRFGLGPRPGELADTATDPRGFVVAQLSRPRSVIIDDPRLKTTADALIIFSDAHGARKAAIKAVDGKKGKQADAAGDDEMAAGGDMDMAMADGSEGGDMAADGTGGGDGKKQRKKRDAEMGLPQKGGVFANRMFRDEVEARYRQAVETRDPLNERLVMFWSNHFCVSTAKNGLIRACAGPYEREAIRPHVLGRFRDLLGASVKHPAMLIYLDNWRSVGPDSPIGKRRGRGLNENLAREVMELHTLGVDGGYTQEDVTRFANVLTGWTVTTKRSPRGVSRFEEDAHEPGAQTILGKTYADTGGEQLDAVLDDLARHPATARHIARKLVQYFIADTPPPGMIEAVSKTFTATDGDLAETVKTLVTRDAAWSTPLVKMRSPYELTIAAIRATGTDLPRAAAAVQELGQRMWAVPSPAGYPETDDAWLGGDALLERIDWAASFARVAAPSDRNVAELGTRVLGPALDEDTLRSIQRAESNEQALTLLIMSPVFQRR